MRGRTCATTTAQCAPCSTSRARKPSTSTCSSGIHAAFVRGFPVECEVIGPSEAIGAEVLRHDPLAVALVILMIEWMTQHHYLGSIRDDGDSTRCSRASEESLDGGGAARQARHADRRRARGGSRPKSRSTRRSTNSSRSAPFSTAASSSRPSFNLDALEKLIGRKLENRDAIEEQQHQAARWTYIGSGMVHERFKATLLSISANAAARIAEAAPVFA